MSASSQRADSGGISANRRSILARASCAACLRRRASSAAMNLSFVGSFHEASAMAFSSGQDLFVKGRRIGTLALRMQGILLFCKINPYLNVVGEGDEDVATALAGCESQTD